MPQTNLKKVILITLLTKGCIFFTIILGFYLLPFNLQAYSLNFHYPEGETFGLANAFKTWDAQHYLFLAEKGYHPDQMSNAFSPLFPFLIKAVTPLFLNNSLIAGLALSNLFSFIAVIFLFLLVKKIFDAETAFISCLFFLVFPTAFYASLVYTESLFLMLVLLFFYSIYQGKFVPAFLLSFVLPLARMQGVLIIIPLLIFLFSQNSPLKKLQGWILVFGLIVGLLTYFIFMQCSTGSLAAGFTAQNLFLSKNSITHLFSPLDWFIRNFSSLSFSLHGFTNSLIDRLFFGGFLILLISMYQKLDKTLFSYSLVMGLALALMGTFMAYSRHLLAVFPIFIVLAILLKERHYFITIPMLVLQVLFLLMHSLNFWVA